MEGMDQEEDREIIKRTRGGENLVFTLLVGAYKKPVFRMTGRYKGTGVQIQDVFTCACKQLAKFTSKKKSFECLYAIFFDLTRKYPAKKTRKRESFSTHRLTIASSYPITKRELCVSDIVQIPEIGRQSGYWYGIVNLVRW